MVPADQSVPLAAAYTTCWKIWYLLTIYSRLF